MVVSYNNCSNNMDVPSTYYIFCGYLGVSAPEVRMVSTNATKMPAAAGPLDLKSDAVPTKLYKHVLVFK